MIYRPVLVLNNNREELSPVPSHYNNDDQS